MGLGVIVGLVRALCGDTYRRELPGTNRTRPVSIWFQLETGHLISMNNVPSHIRLPKDARENFNYVHSHLTTTTGTELTSGQVIAHALAIATAVARGEYIPILRANRAAERAFMSGFFMGGGSDCRLGPSTENTLTVRFRRSNNEEWQTTRMPSIYPLAVNIVDTVKTLPPQ